jgi:hypothetical protein
MLEVMLGIEPAGRELRSDPLLPERITRLELRGHLTAAPELMALAGQRLDTYLAGRA